MSEQLNQLLMIKRILVNQGFHKKGNKNHEPHQLKRVNFFDDKDLLKALNPPHSHDKRDLQELLPQFFSH